MSRHAFLILAHKNPRQVARLVDYLLENGAPVYLHIDKKHRRSFQSFFEVPRAGLFVTAEHNIYWGSFSQIKATLLLLSKCVAHGGFDHVSLISGQDLLIKPFGAFESFLQRHRGKSFLRASRLPDSTFAGNGGLDRVELVWLTNFPAQFGFLFNKANVIIHLLQRALRLRRNTGATFWAGPNWFTLSREAAQYVVDFTASNPDFLRRFRFTKSGDELFVQTILMSSPHAGNMVPDSLRLIDWSEKQRHPRTFTIADAGLLLSSSCFLARKFDEEHDNRIIDEIYATT